jgi:glutamate--cysteine ligase
MQAQQFSAVPHLTTALSAPLHQIEKFFLDNQPDIENWLRRQWQETAAPFYTSVDLRNAGFKLAPVDTNLFPAGFNNLNPAFMPLCIQAAQATIEQIKPTACKVLIVPENHTRNRFYLESLAMLQDILRKAGYEARIGSLLPELTQPTPVALASGKELLLEPLQRRGNEVGLAGFSPCLLLLNNDLSSGIPPILQNLQQAVLPPPQIGWHSRLKSSHFGHYRDIVKGFCEHFDLDPWLIDPLFRNCGEIDFMKREGEKCLAENVDALLVAIQRKYTEYQVPYRPFVMIKADAGTYGMGIMTVHSSTEIRELNRKQRSRMAASKEGQKISKVIVQEGVYSFETLGQPPAVAEPVVYMIGHYVVGGFYRVHTQRGINENLNTPGMRFEQLDFVCSPGTPYEPLAFADSCIAPDQTMAPDACPNRFYSYGLVARLAMLAAAREQAEVIKAEATSRVQPPVAG